MLLMIGPGIISVVFGVLFLVAPQRIIMGKRPPATRWWIATDPFFLKYRISAGICLLAVGVFCLYSALYVWQRLHS